MTTCKRCGRYVFWAHAIVCLNCGYDNKIIEDCCDNCTFKPYCNSPCEEKERETMLSRNKHPFDDKWRDINETTR